MDRKYQTVLLVIGMIIGLLVVPCVCSENGRETATKSQIQLPKSKTKGTMSVAEALSRRRSHRSFSDQVPTLQTIGQLCWAAQGITDKRGFRAAPSAGALFPITIFVVNNNGVYEYRPKAHILDRVLDGDIRNKLLTVALHQSSVGSAPVCIVVTMNVARTATKYGQRAQRYCLLEAGHVAQNVLLQATALDMVGVPIGAFEDKKLGQLLQLPARLQPVYLLPLGYAIRSD